MWKKEFWQATVERVVRASVWTFGGLVAADGFDFRHTDWGFTGNAVGVAATLSLVACLVGNALTKNGPSFSDAEQTVPDPPAPPIPPPWQGPTTSG